MSTSTDAILIYGFDLGEDTPWEEFDEERDTKKSNPLGYRAYMGDPKDGITLRHHCSDSCTAYIIGIAESALVASRGYPEKVPALEALPEWDARLESFAKKHGLEFTSPAWLLASWWG